ncbi:MAG: hypothetical protein ACREXX_03630 [Gammaproteobacteria bacterium]
MSTMIDSRHTLGIAIVFGLLTLENAGAGGFKTLPDDFAETLASIENIQISQPSNSGDAMEPEFYQFPAKRSEDSQFRCRIRQNNTNQNLGIRLLDVDGNPTLVA